MHPDEALKAEVLTALNVSFLSQSRANRTAWQQPCKLSVDCPAYESHTTLTLDCAMGCGVTHSWLGFISPTSAGKAETAKRKVAPLQPQARETLSAG